MQKTGKDCEVMDDKVSAELETANVEAKCFMYIGDGLAAFCETVSEEEQSLEVSVDRKIAEEREPAKVYGIIPRIYAEAVGAGLGEAVNIAITNPEKMKRGIRNLIRELESHLEEITKVRDLAEIVDRAFGRGRFGQSTRTDATCNPVFGTDFLKSHNGIQEKLIKTRIEDLNGCLEKLSGAGS